MKEKNKIDNKNFANEGGILAAWGIFSAKKAIVLWEIALLVQAMA